MKTLLAFLLPGFALTAGAADLKPEDFAFGHPIVTVEKAAVYRFALPADVYGHTVRADLGDLRMFNASGEVVPYTLERPAGDTDAAKPAPVSLPLFALKGNPVAALEAIRVTIESGKAAVNLNTRGSGASDAAISSYIVDARSVETLIAALNLEWPEDAGEFAGRIKVEVSDDLGAWRALVEDAPVANLHADGAGLVERRVEVAATRAKFWRLSWTSAAPPFALTGVKAERAVGRQDVPRSTLTVSGAVDEAHPGDLEFDLGSRLPVDRINFELPEMNSIVDVQIRSRAERSSAWRPVLRHGFYRLETRNGEMRSGPVAIDTRSDRYWLAKIDAQGSGLGKGALRLQVGWLPDEVVFVARGAAPFQLAYGSGSAEPGAAGLDAIPKDIRIVRASAGERVVLGGESRLQPPPPPVDWKRYVLWAVLLLGAALLAIMAYRLSKQL
jgi:hypothetical protein